MNVVINASITVGAVLVGALIFLIVRAWLRSPEDETEVKEDFFGWPQEPFEAQMARVLSYIRDGGGVRYEVSVNDGGLGVDGKHQGWSWTIWDGDQLLRALAYPDPDEDPDGEVGRHKAYLWGDGESTAQDAMAKGFAWVRQQRGYSFLLSPQLPEIDDSLGFEGDPQGVAR